MPVRRPRQRSRVVQSRSTFPREQRRHSGQIEALHEYAEVLREYVEALRQHAERQSGENEALRTRIGRLDGQVERLAECYGTLASTLR